MKTSNKKTALKLLAALLALFLVFAAPLSAFADDDAQSDDTPVLYTENSGNEPSAAYDGGDGATYTFPEDGPEEGKMYIMENPDTSSEPVLTTGAEAPEGQSDSGSKDATAGLSEEEIAGRKEIYTMVTLIALAAILVGIREKRGRR